MRTDSATFNQYNTALAKEPRYVVALSFDRADTDVLYITSHANTPVPAGATALQGLLHGIGGTTQRINPETGVSEIGAISFSVLDKAQQFSSVAAAKLALGYGLRRKKVVIYVGYAGLTWADFQIVATQIVDEVNHKGSVISIACADIQRTLKDHIFDLQKTNLSASITASATLIPVYSVTGFELVAHGTSYTDAPSASVLYIRIDDEVIRCTGTTTDAVLGLCFVADQRGALNTYAVEHKVDSGAAQDTRPAVTEVMYLEMPVPKMQLALLTGSLYNQPGETLPAGWHLGIDSAWVRTADFVNIGKDWWDPADDTKGLIFRFVGEQRQEGKKFIESQLCRQLGAYMPIYSTGELGLIRTTSILSDAAHVAVLDESNCIELPDLKHAMKEVRNIYSVQWNHDWIAGAFTRDTLLVDANSINTHDINSAQILECRGLHGSRHTPSVLATMFDRMRDRFAGPPVRLSLGLLHHMNRLEVGDVVRVQLANATDLNTGTSIDRAFEVQQVAMDWITGRMKVDLFGSSQKAGAIAASGVTSSNVVADSWYSSGGAVALASYPGITTSTIGGVLHITAGHLSGAATMGAAKYYHIGDVQIDGDVTFDDNVMLAIAGHLQGNAKLNGKGQGLAGAAAVASGAGGAAGTAALGVSLSGGGFAQVYGCGIGFAQSRGVQTAGAKNIPLIDLTNNAGQLVAEIPDLRGTSGGSGLNSYDSSGPTLRAVGGAGGAGGAGLVVVCRGLSSGVSGIIDTSGNQGAAGDISLPYLAGSGGGGMPGGVLILIDGQVPASTPVTANSGGYAQPAVAKLHVLETGPCINWDEANMYYSADGWYYMSYYLGTDVVDMSQSCVRIQYIPPAEVAAVDVPPIADVPLGITTNTIINSPKTPGANLCTIEIGVTPPSDTTYLYSNIYYRLSGQEAWTLAGPTAPEATVTLAMDGLTYEFMARSVSSVSRLESLSGPTTSVTVPNVTAPTASDPAPETLLVIPNVTGLELFEQGNDAVFSGKEAKFAWRKTSASDFYNIATLPTGQGADFGALDQYFRDYEVRIYADNTLVRTEHTTDNWYLYSHEKNAEDYLRINSTPGAWREFLIEVVIRVRFSAAVSAIPARLAVSNPKPSLPTAVTISGAFQALALSYTPPTDLDWSGIIVWMSTSTGFTPGDGNKVYDGGDTKIVLTGLTSGTTYYVVFACYDAFGKTGLTMSSEYEVTLPSAITAGEVSGLGNWATRTSAVDLAFIEANIGTDAIPSTRIQSIVAGKIAAGTIAARVAVAGVFTATGTSNALNESGLAAGTWRFDMGPVLDGGTTYIQRFHDGNGNKTFWVDSLGNAGFGGGITGAATVNGTAASTVVSNAAAGAVAEANAKAYADANFVDLTTYGIDIADLQGQIDGNITSWFYDGAPTLLNNPAVNWTDDATKNIHLGDLYYDNLTGYAYRFRVVTGTYSWVQLSDSDIAAALAVASAAQDTADAKRRVFVAEPTTPYDLGDLWDTGGTPRTLKRCTTARATGAYNAADWTALADQTSAAITASVTISSGALNFQTASVTTLSVDGTNKRIWINDTTYGNDGIQIEYNGGNPRAHIGNKNGSGPFIEFDGTDLIARTLKTATSGQRIELNPSGDNELHFYGDRGDTTIVELATIGITTVGSDIVIGNFGSSTSQHVAVRAESSSNWAIYGKGTSGIIGISSAGGTNIGVYGYGTTDAYGVSAHSESGISLITSQNSTTHGAFKISPKSNTTDPTTGGMGEFYVASDGTLKFHNGTAWKTVTVA